MKKSKLKLIETYIYAKTLNIISTEPSSEYSTKQMAEFIENANIMSKELLNACETKIVESKLNDYSFQLLKNELDSIKKPKSYIKNYLKICEMIKNYGNYLKIVSN